MRKTPYCYESFGLPRRSRENPIFFRLSLATELVGVPSSGRPVGGVSLKARRDSSETSSDLILEAELRADEESAVERQTAASASDDGTVTECLLLKSKLRRPALEDRWDSVMSSDIWDADSAVNLRHKQHTVKLLIQARSQREAVPLIQAGGLGHLF